MRCLAHTSPSRIRIGAILGALSKSCSPHSVPLIHHNIDLDLDLDLDLDIENDVDLNNDVEFPNSTSSVNTMKLRVSNSRMEKTVIFVTLTDVRA